MVGQSVIGQAQLRAQIRDLGVPFGGVLVVHTSFRAVRPVEGGPQGLIDALLAVLGPDGTLVMPSMTGSRPEVAYDPATTPTEGMGIVAEMFWRLPGARRSSHPTSSFAALGPLADFVTGPQPVEPVHGVNSSIGRVSARDGWVLLLGVGHSDNTTIHLGEQCASVPYRSPMWATVRDGDSDRRIEFFETNHCCQNFDLVDNWLECRGVQRTGRVGHAEAKLMRSAAVVSTVAEELAGDVLRFLCPAGSGCAKCDTARASIPENASG